MERNDRMPLLDAQVRWGRRVANTLWRARHDGSDFSIICNNCWGGAICQGLRRPYLSPFAGLFLMGPCFMHLIEDLRGHLAHPPRPARESRYESVRRVYGSLLPYPVGLLGDDVEVHFLHYATWDEALDKWMRRTARIRWDRLFVKFGDQNGSSADLVRRFLELPFERKLCLTNRAEFHGRGAVVLGGEGPTSRLQEDMEYRRHVDVPDWLCGGRTRGGGPLRRWSRRADAFAAGAAVRRAAAQSAAARPPEMNLDEQAAALAAPGSGIS
jgi:uncharacterized protein (DUF1919 family)